MKSATKRQSSLTRRDVLRNGGAVAVLFGLGVATPPTAAAATKPELVEAIASNAGLSKADATDALEALLDATTKALANGERVAISQLGLFTVSRRGQTGNGNGSKDGSAVEFDACPAFAAALDLGPENGDERRNKAGSSCRSADVVIDADRIATDTQRGTDRGGLSKADSKKALDGFVDATTEPLAKGETVSLVGFGSFSISKRSARTGRNPQTGKELQAAGKNVVTFKAGAELSKSVN